MAWESWIVPLKVIGSDGLGSYTNIARALIWAAENGVDVANLSIGGPAETLMLQDAVSYARSHGVTVVAAVGNGGTEDYQYPAAHEGVVAVAASGPDDASAPFSSTGSHVDVAAPGIDVLTTTRGHGHQWLTGTSMSAPIVSGLAALLAGLHAGLSPLDIEQLIAETAVDIGAPGWDAATGFGRVDASAALARAAAPSPTATVLPLPTATDTPSAIRVAIGETIRGSADDSSPAERYCFEGSDWVSIRMFGSGGFDPILRIFELGGSEALLANDNGQGIRENAFLALRLAPGQYCLEAGGRGQGDFAIRIEEGRSAAVGDVDKDCVVGPSDLELIVDSMGSMIDGDTDLDLSGMVTQADEAIWRRNYVGGVHCP